MPCIASLEAFERAAARFEIAELELMIEPSAGEAVRRSLDESGLLLLGEVHGVRENPLIIRALMQAFGLSSLALEWPADLTGVISDFVAGGMLSDHPLLWLGDGRITAGHLAVLRERARAGQLDLALFDGITGADGGGSQQDEAMAGQILASATAASGTLAVAGNAHTPASPASRGSPLGACLSRQRPGVLDIRINYGRGGYYSMRPSRIYPSISIWPNHTRLYQEHGSLILELPAATEAIVPHRPRPWPQFPRNVP
ncbi:MAG: hypothetical protein JWM19_3027 [Actinomycetia bacterium]|nr:hypothetical protein [Actinomycetes bacterium]